MTLTTVGKFEGTGPILVIAQTAQSLAAAGSHLERNPLAVRQDRNEVRDYVQILSVGQESDNATVTIVGCLLNRGCGHGQENQEEWQARFGCHS
jgi:hypothetical protein